MHAIKLFCYCLLLTIPSYAQINRYLPDTWKQSPVPTTPANAEQPYTLLQYAVVRDFNVPEIARMQYVTHYKTVYRHIRVNAPLPGDSLTQLVIPLESNERHHFFQSRILHASGEVVPVQGQVGRLRDGRAAVVLAPLELRAGSELEYDITLTEQDDYAGTEILQFAMPCEKAQFRLIAPAGMVFRHKSSNGFPALTDSVHNGIRQLDATAFNIPALTGDNGLYYYQPHLQRVGFALHTAVEKGQADTLRNTWQAQGEETYLQYVNLDRQEYRRLEKELEKWPFVRQQLPLPDLIYRVEQHIKTNYKLVQQEDRYDLTHLADILQGREANETGMIRLMNAVYYMLGVPCQLLFTAARDEIPLDSSLVNMKQAKHVLLYFPGLQLALAPTEMNTRFPCYPPLWGNTTALRCRDTLIGDKRTVLADMIRTPLPDYTWHNITLEAGVQLNAQQDSLRIQARQAYGGYPALIIREITAGKAEADRNNLYGSLLPFKPGRDALLSLQASNEQWDARDPKAPLTLQAAIGSSSLVTHNGSRLEIGLGQLLGAVLQQQSMPPAGIPVEMVYPFYQERRLYIDLPAGYKAVNIADFNTDTHYEEGGKPLLGSKITCRQENNQISIYAIEWYRETVFGGDARNAFQRLMEQAATLKNKVLILEKG